MGTSASLWFAEQWCRWLVARAVKALVLFDRCHPADTAICCAHYIRQARCSPRGGRQHESQGSALLRCECQHHHDDKVPCYEVSLAGHLDDHWSMWFGGLTTTRELDGTTRLRGIVADQAELHGLLARVRDLGATLIALRAVETSRS